MTWPAGTADTWLLFPRHVWKFLRQFDWRRFGLSHGQFRITAGCAGGRRHVASPRSDAGLESVVFGSFLIADFLVKKREVGMNELFVRLHLLGLMALRNGRETISFSIIGHRQGKLGVEMVRVFRQHGFQLCDGERVITLGVIEHRIGVLFLQCRHIAFDNEPYRTDAMRKQARMRGGFGEMVNASDSIMVKRDK